MAEETEAIAIIGLGNAGLPLAAVAADSGIDVIGIDISASRCQQINQGINPIPEEAGLEELIRRHGGQNLTATPKIEDARSCHTFIVIVPVFVDQSFSPDFSIMLLPPSGCSWRMIARSSNFSRNSKIDSFVASSRP